MPVSAEKIVKLVRGILGDDPNVPKLLRGEIPGAPTPACTP